MNDLKAILIGILAVAFVGLGFSIFFTEAGESSGHPLNLTSLDQSTAIGTTAQTIKSNITSNVQQGTSSKNDLGFIGTLTVVGVLIKDVPSYFPNMVDALFDNLGGSVDARFKAIIITASLIFVGFAVFLALIKWR